MCKRVTDARAFDVLVVGAGPAGIAAACVAAESGARVGLVDDNPAPGGQIWRGESFASEAAEWSRRLAASRAELIRGTRVVAAPEPGLLIAESFDALIELRYSKLILATGARERFLPFPGWTLPNVMGAGGLQAIVKSGLPIEGQRIVVAGTGPLLLAVAAYLKKHGARVVLIAEQTSRASLARFVARLWRFPNKIKQALQLRRDLRGVPQYFDTWPIAAEGREKLDRVTLRQNAKAWTVECDYLACGFHLVPNTELAELLGCAIRKGFVQVDEAQQTTVPNIFCAGEPTGVGGVELALVEGQIAGCAAAQQIDKARALFVERRKLRRFADSLERAFALRDELKSLCAPDTLVCRCEDVPFARLAQYDSWRAAKLETRCGMGPCQGRVCGAAAEFLFGWRAESVRPPIFPARVEALASRRTGTSELV
jgi:NADPH-dependent 2,4-dienoyl-CoA reductase/sulfur reductase-like enzyme